MRFITLALSGLAAVSALVIPADSAHHVSKRQSVPTPEQIDATIAQAVYISQNLDSELKRISKTIANDPLLKLQPTDYDTPGELTKVFAKAQSGIEALPTLTPDDNIPAYVAEHYAPLVGVVGESLFLSLLDFERLTQAIFQNEAYDNIVEPFDGGIYNLVVALNGKFQGFGCALSKSVGENTPAGQALKIASEQLFFLLFDSIAQGQC